LGIGFYPFPDAHLYCVNVSGQIRPHAPNLLRFTRHFTQQRLPVNRIRLFDVHHAFKRAEGVSRDLRWARSVQSMDDLRHFFLLRLEFADRLEGQKILLHQLFPFF